MGDPFQPFIYGPSPCCCKTQCAIMYGENGEVEYGGDMKNALSPTRVIQDHDAHYFSGLPPESWQTQTRTYKPTRLKSTLWGTTLSGIRRKITITAGNTPNLSQIQKSGSKYASLVLGYIKFGIGRLLTRHVTVRFVGRSS